MANKVKYGFKNVSYAVITEAEDGSYTYGTPVSVKGGVKVSLAPVGDTLELYADDTLYHTETVNQGYSGDLETVNLPQSFFVDVLGMTIDDNGAVIENSKQKAKKFAFGFEVDGDSKGRRTWFYNCSCTRPSDEASTKESGATPTHDTVTLTVAPRPEDSQVKVKMVLNDTNETAYNGFFASVYEETVA